MAVLAIPFSMHNLPRLPYISDKPERLLSSPLPTHSRGPKTRPASMSRKSTLHLLSLPAEIRLQIYSLVVAQTSCFRHSHTRPPSQGIALALLRVNREIYNEARLLPFQISDIAFQKWYGSSVFCCSAFLKSIQDWQRREVRTLNLTLNGRELSGWQAREGWLQICNLLSTEVSVAGGVRSMTLNVNGTRGFKWDDLLNMDAAWVREGLQKIKSLRKMVIVLSDADVERKLVSQFEESLKQCIPLVEVRTIAPPPAEPPLEERTFAFAWNL